MSDLLLSVWEDIDTSEIHSEEMDAVSFCAVENNRYIGYAGVVSWDISVQDETFKMCGLSCVCTHPQYRRKGVGSALVKAATEWVIRSGNSDIGLFTCSYEHTPFYESIGLWKQCPGLVLKESDREGAYRSDHLRVNVFKLLISQKAALHADYFEDTTILLNFPNGKFI